MATIQVEKLVSVVPTVSIGVGRSLPVALSLLTPAIHAHHLLIPDPRESSDQQIRDVEAVVDWLMRTSDVTIGLSGQLDAHRLRRRCPGIELGRGGWYRVVFGQRSLILEDADLPADLLADRQIVLVSRPAGRGCLSSWVALAHPNTQLRANASGNARIELAMGVTAAYLLLGEDGGQTVVILANSAITAELAARALERLGPRRRGFESVGPWEEPGVQHLAELGEATPAVMQLAVRLAVEDNAGERIGREIAEMLGWSIPVHTALKEGNDR